MASFAFSVEKIGKKSGKKQEWHSDVAELFTWSACISKCDNQCKYSQKNQETKSKKRRIDMMQAVVDNIAVVFT